MMLLPLTLLPILLAAAPAFADNNAYLALTTNGPIIGHPAANAPGVVAEYLGIPYAQPPLGPLRFAAPQPYGGPGNPNNDTAAPFIASHYGFTCPQTASARVAYPDRTPQAQRIVAAFAGQLNHSQSEDCLTLNIWTRATATNTTAEEVPLKPILVFIHGGRFTIGESHTPFFDGTKLAAAQDVVVVTLNYRVSIFGFPGDAAGPKNLAFRDQRLAVEWVRDNAAAFGGDAGRIVVAGQSAGGAAVDYWAYAYREDPVVAGIVPMSGNVWSFPVSSAETAGERWKNVSAAAGCVAGNVGGDAGDDAGGDGVLECMRGKDFEVIKKAVAGLKLPTVSGQGRSEAVFQPTVDNETVFDQEMLKKMTQAGEFARVPYLVGNTHFEAGYYRWAAYGAGSILTDAQWDNFNLVTFTCPSTYGAAARARFGVPSWVYRYGGDWDNLRLYPNSSAYHGSDMHALFGNSEEVSGLPEEEAQTGLTRVVMEAWAAFARDSRGGLHDLGWGEYSDNILVELGFNKSALPTFASPQKYASTCASLNLSFYSD
ncbi:Acetylcholinesterase [Lasiodiplodia theobromae]|uniref:Carboxylic ester hydrolase n=1 Tax=Lasiodiplodia theobromae TaxID=45133 RepID=A0A5N5D6T8_9PEZI|nr:Acetylcholinesterase [Lasiodiplodia theobromae]